MLTGRIIRGVGGFYYVSCGDLTVYECRARGVLRRKGIRPCVGDDVTFSPEGREEGKGYIDDILPRKNALVRPQVVNVDQVIVMFAVKDPDPAPNLIDRLLIEISKKELEAVLCFNKTDLAEEKQVQELMAVYAGSGVRLIALSLRTGEGFDELGSMLAGKLSVLAGPSGAGKSSLINRLIPERSVETGELSEKIRRGKNTTRHAELFRVGGLAEGTYICDTPGFSSFELNGIEAAELSAYYPEFTEHIGDCRFRGCSHIPEPDCGVKAAVADGSIPRVRYENYCTIYSQLINNQSPARR